MVCQVCFIFLLQSNVLLIYASNASFREASKISSPFSICPSVMVSGARFCGVSVLFLQHEFPAVVGDTGICQNYEFSSMDIVIQSCIHF